MSVWPLSSPLPPALGTPQAVPGVDRMKHRLLILDTDLWGSGCVYFLFL